MKKGTQITEEQIRWSEISDESWKAARSAAAARAANGNPMTDAETEIRARNNQDREDIRTFARGVNMSADCKNMTRSELIAHANVQLMNGLGGSGKGAGLRSLKAQLGTDGAQAYISKKAGRTVTLR